MIDAWGPQEIAKRLGVKPATVYQWRQRGVIPEPDAVVSRVPMWASATIAAWAATTGRRQPITAVDRILWNERGPDLGALGNNGGDIDEIVMSDVDVHVEQMNDRCWSIGITRRAGGYWLGD